MTADARIGTELGPYRIESLLGRGGMSVVYLATDTRLKRRVALKVLAAELGEDERFRERFVRESELAASLDHPNIVPIFEAGEVDGLLYISMRFVEGTDLGKVLRANGPLDPDQTVSVLGPVASALDAAHAKGLVHRDVKPANILISGTEWTGSEHVYLSDFGLTKRMTSISGLTQTGQFMGTVDYVAPEQVQGSAVTGAADQYSLGCVAYECLTGGPPFRKEADVAVMWSHVNEPPPLLRSDGDERRSGLDEAIAKALAKTAAERHRTCSEFVTALAVPAPTTRAAVPAGPLARAKRRWARLPRVAVAAVLAVLVVAGVAGLLLTRGGSAERREEARVPTQTAVGRGAIRIDPRTNRVAKVATVENALGDLASAGGFVWVVDNAGISKVDSDHAVVVGRLDGRYCCLEGEPDALWAEHIVEQAGGVFQSALVRIDPSTNRVTRFGEHDIGIADIEVADGFVWYTTAERGDSQLVRFDPDTGRERSYAPESAPGGCSFEGCASEILAVGEGAAWFLNMTGTLTRLDAQTGDDQKVVVPGADGVAVGEGFVWVLDREGKQVLQLDPDLMREITRFPVRDDPRAIAVGLGAVWVVNRGDASVTRIDPASRSMTTIRVGVGLGNIIVDDTGVWVVR
jgi:serine/threonine-protein kinase